MNKGLFITGTDTDVGKTIVSQAILRYLNAAGERTLGIKPVCCGSREDVEALQIINQEAGFTFSDDEVNPLFLTEPAAPISVETDLPPLSEIVSSFSAITQSSVLVEGAGGWAVPVTDEWGMDDLATELNLPIILVINNKLGALNHSILTARAIKERGLPLLGYVLNNITETDYPHAQQTNRSILDQVLDAPCLAEIPLDGGQVSSEPLRNALKMCHLLDLPLHFEIPNS